VASESRWEEQAQNWIKWARAPAHDSYWYYAPTFFREIVPQPNGLTLEIGCGEGRVARDLTARGHRVVAVDSSPTLVRHAVDADRQSDYLIADSASLPFADSAFDLLIAYNSLQDVSDMPGTIREAARVLTAGGSFCVCITHPLADAGAFNDREPDPEFVISGSYLGRRVFEGTVERDGLTMTFHGWAYPLEDYTRALQGAGFLIECLREPVPSPDDIGKRPSLEPWQRIPAYVFIRAIRGPA
jgi:Methylase involved in ubiquinone/menaquinone biosynthesis